MFPALNITSDKGPYDVRAELSVILAGDLEPQVHNKSLSISGERKIASDIENVKQHRRELGAGRLSRIIELPGEGPRAAMLPDNPPSIRRS